MRPLPYPIVFILIAAGCAGANDIDAGGPPGPGGAIGDPIDAPTQATFSARMQPFLEAEGCASGGACHATAGGGGGFLLVTDAPSPAEVGANYEQSICNDRLASYGAAPSGKLIAYFCSGPGAPNGGHSGIVASATFCQDLYDWAAEGSGAAPPCP